MDLLIVVYLLRMDNRDDRYKVVQIIELLYLFKLQDKYRGDISFQLCNWSPWYTTIVGIYLLIYKFTWN